MLGGTGKIQTILKTVAVNSLRIVIYDAGNGDGDQIVACTGGVASGGGGRHIGAGDVGADRPRLRREIMNTGRTVRFGDTRRNHGIMASETTNHHIGLASQHGGQRAVM